PNPRRRHHRGSHQLLHHPPGPAHRRTRPHQHHPQHPPHGPPLLGLLAGRPARLLADDRPIDRRLMNPVAPLRVTAERLHPRDAVFVYDETDRHLSNIIAVYAFDASDADPLTTDQVLDWVRARLGHAKLFHRRLQRLPL